MKRIKIKRIDLLNLNVALKTLAGKTTALSWAVMRTSESIKSEVAKYYNDVKSFIEVFSEKDENGKAKLKENASGKRIDDYIYANAEEAAKAISEMQQEVVTVSVYEATKEKLIEYLNSNPAPNEYAFLMNNIINPDFIG